jgi:hypothetical protein
LNKQRSAIVVLALALVAVACADKKSPKPVHTEPWLAHPPASAAITDAAVPSVRYVLGPRSQIQFELSTKRGKVQGKLASVQGELRIALGALGQSRGELRADLASLSLDDDSPSSAEWLARAKSALGLTDAGSTAASPVASFEVTGLSDLSTEALEPPPARDGGGAPSRRVRATVEGNLLLNGFRVLKRAPLEAEFGFGRDGAAPSAVVIRSRAPLVVSLETHEIHLREPARAAVDRHRKQSPSAPHDVRVSLELYGTKD